MKIMILGSDGMLGEIVSKYFDEKDIDIRCCDRKDFDATNLQSVDDLFKYEKYRYVINCVGILNNKKDMNLYAKVNIVFPHYLQHLSAIYNFKLIHISTNCVFDNYGPHESNDVPNAKDLYGTSKMFGEVFDKNNITIRTSIIGQSKNGSGLLNWFLNNNNPIIEGYINAQWNGVTTLELAKQIYKIIENTEFVGNSLQYDNQNLIQIATEGMNSKYDLLCLFNRIYCANKTILPIVSKDVHSSILVSDVKNVPSIEQQLQEFKEWYK